MMKVRAYRKKPVTVQALQWTGTLDNLVEMAAFAGDEAFVNDGKLEIDTLEGKMTASIGDYIIKGVKGEYYPCRKDIFEETYYEVEDD
jgi:hypothetical protein